MPHLESLKFEGCEQVVEEGVSEHVAACALVQHRVNETRAILWGGEFVAESSRGVAQTCQYDTHFLK